MGQWITYTMVGIKTEGLKRLRSTLATASKALYETKKMVRVWLNCRSVMGISLVRLAILAFPMLVRSRKQMR